MQCPVCQGRKNRNIFNSELKWSVRSDWRPVPASIELFECDSCNHVFKSFEQVEKWASYENYELNYHGQQSEKMSFNAEYPVTRSQKIVRFLKENNYINEQTKVLDFGCNFGSFLSLFPENQVGFDVSEKYRDHVESKGHKYFSLQKPIPKSYDKQVQLISLVHVLEHLSDIQSILEPVLEFLDDRGLVLIQVPDYKNQPTDFYVIDHVSHFNMFTLHFCMKKIGLETVFMSRTFIEGEIFALFTKSKISQSEDFKDPVNLNEIITSLNETENIVRSLSEKNEKLTIYGAGMVGAFLYANLKEKVEDFIDDNKNLENALFFGKRIRMIEGASQNQKILVATPPSLNEKISGKCIEKKLNYILPFKTFHKGELNEFRTT